MILLLSETQFVATDDLSQSQRAHVAEYEALSGRPATQWDGQRNAATTAFKQWHTRVYC